MSENSETPDTAMATGSDEGEPGERRDGGPLTPDEQRLLEQLGAPDDTPEAAAAAADDAPLPAASTGPGDQDDGLTPEFTDR